MTEPPIVRPPPANAGPAAPRSKWSFVLESRVAMFGMLFCVTGFLGLPLLWMSQKFTHAEKVVWSVVVVIYTLVLIGLTIAICWWSYSQLSQIMY
jgi:uncharacterized membrane protein YcjF (UPF0283 family)